MKVMPLPIEYLWLLDYDERMLEYIYEWDYKMQKTIYVEHSECLTTEESLGRCEATVGKFSGFLEEDF